MRHLKMVFILFQKRLIADGINALISQNPILRVIGMKQLDYHQHFPNNLPNQNIDLFILEIDWPQNYTLTLLDNIQQKHPKARTLLISNLIDNPLICDIISTDLGGFILKGNSKEMLTEAIYQISQGNSYFAPSITKTLLRNIKNPQSRNGTHLTEREKQVLELITQMFSNSQIAHKLSISKTTVKTHRQNIMKKFGAHNLIALIRYACRENFIHHDTQSFCHNCPHRVEVNCHHI